MENSSDKPTVRELNRAAYVCDQLDDFLGRCMAADLFELEDTGCFAWLSAKFETAAKQMAAAQ